MPVKNPKVRGPESSLSQYAYDMIRSGILKGDLPLGSLISRRQLAKILGMSHLPVAEALQRLETDGLVETLPRSGTRVKTPTAHEIRGHYVVREALEVQSARLFAEKASQQEKEELQKMAVQMDFLLSDDHVNLFEAFRFHEQLHRRIAECSGCLQLRDAIVKNHVLTFNWLFTDVSNVTRIHSIHSGWHQKLLEVLSQGNPEQAEQKMREHVRTGTEEVLQRLEVHFRSDPAQLKPFARNRTGVGFEGPRRLSHSLK